MYAKRDSFVKMKERMEERGITTRSSIEFDLPRVMDGSIILAVTDPMVLGFLQSEMSKMGATINVAPATGMVQLDTLLQKGGFDGLLIGPEFLQQEGIVPHIKNKYRVPVYAYGYTKMGPNQQLIESSGVDGWVEGPSFGTPFDSEGLANAIGQMQKLKGSYSVPSMPGMMGMMGAIPSMGSVSSMTSMPMMYGMQGVAAADPGSPSIYAGGVNMQMAQMQQNAFTGMQTPLRMQPPVGMQTPTGMQSPVGVPSGMKTPPMMAQEQMNLHMAQMQQMMAQMQQMQQQPQEISLVDQMKYMQSTQPFK